jgi:hypothetical protein
VQRLLGALELAEPGGYMRSFIDERRPHGRAIVVSSCCDSDAAVHRQVALGF